MQPTFISVVVPVYNSEAIFAGFDEPPEAGSGRDNPAMGSDPRERF